MNQSNSETPDFIYRRIHYTKIRSLDNQQVSLIGALEKGSNSLKVSEDTSIPLNNFETDESLSEDGKNYIEVRGRVNGSALECEEWNILPRGGSENNIDVEGYYKALEILKRVDDKYGNQFN